MHVVQFVVFILVHTPVSEAVPAQYDERFRKTTTVVQSCRIPGINATLDYVIVGVTAGLAFLQPGHPQATVCALTEKIADQVRRRLHGSVVTSLV